MSHEHEFSAFYATFGPYKRPDVHYHPCMFRSGTEQECGHVLVGPGRSCQGRALHVDKTLPARGGWSEKDQEGVPLAEGWPAKPIGPTGHLATAEYWRGLYSDAIEEGQKALNEAKRLQAMVDVLLPVAKLYVDAFKPEETMTLPERMRLQQVEDILADPAVWSPDKPIGGG